MAFSPFRPSNLECHDFYDDDSNNNNNSNSSSNNLMSDYRFGPIYSPVLFHEQGEDGEHQLVNHDGGLGLGLGLEESPQAEQKSASSVDHENGRHDHHQYSALSKKLNHNARERDRRKRINASYSSLRALLPVTPLHNKEELSIPEIVSLVVDYIPELQEQVQDLIHRKEQLLSKFSSLQDKDGEGKIKTRGTASLCTSISLEKLEEREIVIHISTYERISFPEVLLLLENNYGFLVLNASSFQSFGGRTFCSIHLWIEGANTIAKWDTLNEELHALFEKGTQANRSKPLLYF